MQTQVAGYQLSPQQRRLWALQRGSAAYAAQCALLLPGHTDAERLRRALAAAVGRHEILRTTFPVAEGLRAPVQVVGEELRLDWREAEAGSAPAGEAGWQELFAREREALAAGSRDGGGGVRALLLREGAAGGRVWLVLSAGAMCADEWALGNVAREAVENYARAEGGESGGGAAGEAGGGSDEEDEVLQYAGYAQWQLELQEDEESAAGRQFWELRRGEGVEPRLGSEKKAASEQSVFAPEQVRLELSPETAERLRAGAEASQASPAAFLFGCWQALLWRHARQEEFTVAFQSDGRKFEELREGVGLYAKSLPVPVRVDASDSIASLAARAEAAMREADSWQEYYFAEEASAADSRLLFAYAEWPAGFGAGEAFRPVARYSCPDRFRLKLECAAFGGGAPALALHFDPAFYAEADVRRLAGELAVLLEDAAADTSRPVGRLELLSADERARLLGEFNRTGAEYPSERCVHHLFEEQAERAPGQTALRLGEEAMSFAELNARANRLAHLLRERHGVGPDTLVGILLGRGVEMVVALLGVLKAGGGYVPLDTSYPKERLGFMLEDARVRVLLTETRAVEGIELNGAEVLRLDAAGEELARADDSNPEGGARPENLAYVIYTSGSTGRPKGVMVTHRGLTNYLHWAAREYVREGGAGAPVHSSVGFDLTVTSIYCPLLAGQAVELIPEAEGVEGLSASMRRSDFSLVKITPSHLEVLNQWLHGEEAAGAGALVIGGEQLLGESLGFWHTYAPQTRIVNEYGPTETVVGCCVYELARGETFVGAVPIGRPIANTRIYILDGGGQPVPVGVAGELFIGGAGVARGYLGRPALTAERFVPDAFSAEAGARLYRTGDLGRFRADGVIEFLGRNDEQVKVRGYRIELGEVEAVLARHPEVAEAVVVAHEDGPGERRLVAYVVPRGEGGGAQVSELRRWMGEQVPDYMVPSAFISLRQLPLTAHGKVDRRALPAPDRTRPELEQAYVAPTTPVEQVLAAIWTEVLGIEQVGINDSFFSLGGDSIRSVRIVALARERGLEFTVQQLFQFQTIGEMARELERTAGLAGAPEPEAAGEEAEDLSQLLEELEGISEEEALAMLREKMRAGDA